LQETLPAMTKVHLLHPL